MIDLNAMALFAKVAEYRSFSEASRRIGVPVSTVSRRVGELEKSLGVRLIERSTRNLRLTGLGEEYFEYCRRGLEEFEAGTLRINDRQMEVSGTLRLSAPPSLTDGFLVPLVSAFQAQYRNAVFKILVTDRKVNLIEDGVDLALRVGELADSTLVAKRLMTYRHVLVAAPGYLADAGIPRHPADLRTHRLIAFGAWYGRTQWRLVRNRARETIEVEASLSMNDHAGIRRAVEGGLGIAEMPSILCRAAISEGRMVEVLPDWKFPPTVLSAVYPSKRDLPRVVRLFKDFCAAHMAALAEQPASV